MTALSKKLMLSHIKTYFAAALMAVVAVALFAYAPAYGTSVNGNKPPTVKSVSGPTELTAKATGTWIVNAEDPDGTELVYILEWGDGSQKSEERKTRGSGGEKTEDLSPNNGYGILRVCYKTNDKFSLNRESHKP